MSIRSRVAIPDIQLKVTYGYAPNIRTITQPVSVSTLNLGLNSIKIEDPKLLREIKANPELKLYPSVVINSTLSPNFSDIVVGQTYYPPEKTYYENIHEEKLLNMLIGVDFTDPINDDIIDVEQGNCAPGFGYVPGCGCVPWDIAQLGICACD